jgi:hypothetical protein
VKEIEVQRIAECEQVKKLEEEEYIKRSFYKTMRRT